MDLDKYIIIFKNKETVCVTPEQRKLIRTTDREYFTLGGNDYYKSQIAYILTMEKFYEWYPQEQSPEYVYMKSQQTPERIAYWAVKENCETTIEEFLKAITEHEKNGRADMLRVSKRILNYAEQQLEKITAKLPENKEIKQLSDKDTS